tara:strand:+ start:288 stop:863 length:576 start_codon:yes stop_codon:yes gene_type:complete
MKLIRENTIHSLRNSKVEYHSGVEIQELGFVNKVNLRINPDSKFISIYSKIFEATLPMKPNSYSINDKIKCIWLGPNEWLLVNYENNLIEKLNDEISDIETSVTDISENKTILRIKGKKILTLLSKFLVLNLEKNLKEELSCAQTLFVKVPVLLVRNNKENDIPEIDIFINRSQSNYVYNLLVDGTKNLNF